jgi:hypothetical protein
VVTGINRLQAQYGANALHALKIRSSDTPDYNQYVKNLVIARNAEFCTYIRTCQSFCIAQRNGFWSDDLS